jgi:hypothetical protein
MDSRQPLAQDESRQGRSLVFEQLLDVTRADPLSPRQRRDRYICALQVPGDFGFDRPHARRAQAAAFGNLRRIARRPDRQGEEIVDVRCSGALQFRRAQRTLILENVEIPHQQPQHAGVRRQRSYERILEAGSHRHHRLARHADADEAGRSRQDVCARIGVRYEEASACLRGCLPATLRDGAAPPLVDVQDHVVVVVGSRASSKRAIRRRRHAHHADARIRVDSMPGATQLVDHHLDVERVVRDRRDAAAAA